MTNLPSSWTLCEIGDVLEAVEKTAKHEKDREIWYVDISSIDNESFGITAPKRLMLSSAPSRARQKIQFGDVLFSTVRPYLRNIAFVDRRFDNEIASTGFSVLRGSVGIDPKYLFYKCISHDFVSALTGEQYGVSYPAIKAEHVSAQTLELPPVKEQHRISKKIEALFAEIDKGVKCLQSAMFSLDLYRKSLLKSAFEGRLTADWRTRNPDKLEDPKTLLTRIRKERENHYRIALDDWEKAVTEWKENGKKGKKPAKPKMVKHEIKQPILEVLSVSTLPDDWVAVKVVSVLEIVSGATPKGINSCNGKGIPFFKISDMNAEGNETELSRAALNISVYEAQALGLTVCPTGTIVFPKRGGAILTNKKRRLRHPSCFDLNTMGLVNQTTTVLQKFTWFWMLGVDLSTIYDGSNVPQINNKNVEPLSFPICSPDEQAEIVRILGAHLDVLELLHTEINAAFTRSEALRQSILKLAFSGQLVPQDPNDEPAAVLLNRIKAESAPNKRKLATPECKAAHQ